MKLTREYQMTLEGSSSFEVALTSADDFPDDVKLSFANGNMLLDFNAEPKQMWKLGQMILEGLTEEGFCAHGNRSESCQDCILHGTNQFPS